MEAAAKWIKDSMEMRRTSTRARRPVQRLIDAVQPLAVLPPIVHSWGRVAESMAVRRRRRSAPRIGRYARSGIRQKRARGAGELHRPFVVTCNRNRVWLSRRTEGAVSGIGLFAECLIAKGTLLGAFTGMTMTTVELAARRAEGLLHGSSVVRVDRNLYLDPTRGHVSCWRWLNSCVGTTHSANVVWVTDGVRVMVRAKTHIRPGEELLAVYDWRNMESGQEEE